MIKVPYSLMELRAALIIFDEKDLDEKKMNELAAEFDSVLSADDHNQRIAEYHGISVEQLINSPNYKALCGEYGESVVKEFAKKLKEKFEITDKEAWALVFFCLGLLN